MTIAETTTAPLLTKDEAQSLTDRIRKNAERLWSLVHQAYEGRAWEVLGYKSFGAYMGAEFDLSKSEGNRLVNQGRVIKAIAIASGVSEEQVPVSNRQARAITTEQATEIGQAVREVPVVERSAALREAIATRASTPAPETPTTGVGLHEDRLADNGDAGLAELAEDVDWEAEASHFRGPTDEEPGEKRPENFSPPAPVPAPTSSLKADQAARTLSRILALDPTEVAKAYMAASDDQLGVKRSEIVSAIASWTNDFVLELSPF